MENLKNMKNIKMPKGGGVAGGLGGLLAAAGLGVYTLSNCLFNVEGGHRAIVFNRVVGIKENVSACPLSLSLSNARTSQPPLSPPPALRCGRMQRCVGLERGERKEQELGKAAPHPPSRTSLLHPAPPHDRTVLPLPFPLARA